MRDEVLINATPRETRVAVVENGIVQELMLERMSRRGIVGNIYKGKVLRVLPGMQSAFVDIGAERAAFLHLSDINQPKAERGEEEATTDITKLLSAGDKVVVQVIKDPMGTKGARLTTQITIASRYLVYMPYSAHIGVSQRIECEEERERLKSIIVNAEEGSGGYIIRTAAESAPEESLVKDVEFLNKLWSKMTEQIPNVKPGEVIHEDLPLLIRTMRDIDSHKVDKVRVDSNESYLRIKQFVNNFLPELEPKLELYTGERPIFDLYSVEDDIQKALHRSVQLKSGGYLVIDQTEAMTTIDVNTGAYVGHRNLEETIFKTNLEAASSLARQLRLRNLGGIIIIDFIDMTDEEHKRQVLRNLEKGLAKDYAKTQISEVSSLGLVQMTRKRTRESLEHILCQACPVCDERGSVKSVETMCLEIFREILRSERAFGGGQKFVVMANMEIVEFLHDEGSYMIAELEEFIEKTVEFKTDNLYTQEQYDVVLM
ncbi:MAG: ribonuclease G [Gammaproteobacteria bacterium]|nr:ribonuclease G [Gammaproteobacteria bacterium]NNJ72629.1 ribonuclease G [Enterobacterales bacterium]